MTLDEFQRQIVAVALASSICEIPTIRRLTATFINVRVNLVTGEFIDTFYNEQTSTVAFALIRGEERIFGADNTGGWHIHPFDAPARHDPLPGPMTFAEFVAAIEKR